MMMAVDDFFGGDNRQKNSLIEKLPYFIIPACIIFNFILCFINTRFFSITIPMVIACEVVLVAMSSLYGFFKIDRLKLFWVGVLLLQIAIILVLSMYRQEFLMKPLRDMIIVPVFIVLGLSAGRLNIVPMLFWLSGIIIVFALFEGFLLSTFIEYFNIRRFYVEKGVLGEDYFIPLDLSASGIRPNERFLIEMPFHRVSSVFLEPVSMGFVGFIIGLFLVSVRKHLPVLTFIAGLGCAYFIILASDGRMAFGSLTMILLLHPILARIDHRFSLLIFPCLLFIAFIIHLSGVGAQGGEGIGWRIEYTVRKFIESDLDFLLGISTGNLDTEDSGMMKIIYYQGIVGFLLFWLAPILFMRKLPEEPKIYLFGVSLFIAFGFLLSAAIVSIKSMALLWFLYGYLVIRSVRSEAGQNAQETAVLSVDISGR